MKISAATFEKPAPKVVDPADNPAIELVRPFVEKGIDTAFAVDTTVAEYKADKLTIQAAVNYLGFTAREVEKPEIADDAEGPEKIKATFLIRPKRAPKGEKKTAEAETAAE